jgi:hypothetical protein
MTDALFDARPETVRGAHLSTDGQYRYVLTRRWDFNRPIALGIGLNPSTADHQVDDLTAVKMIGFAKRWDCGGYALVNLYAYRATDPDEMFSHHYWGADIVGPENDAQIRLWLVADGPIVACWGSTRPSSPGARAFHEQRISDVCDIVRDAGRTMQCLGTTKDGHPRHPSRLAYATALVPFGGA